MLDLGGISESPKPQSSYLDPAIASETLDRLGSPKTSVKTRNRVRDDMSEEVKMMIEKNQREEQARIDAKRAEHLLALEQQKKDIEKRDHIHEKLKGKLLAWSGDPKAGTLKNIRALLSTLDQILWEGAKWKPLSMADMVQVPKVKKCYYKAVRLVHPDRSQTGTIEQQYISGWVMDSLKIAWDKFQSTEMR